MNKYLSKILTRFSTSYDDFSYSFILLWSL